MWKLCKFLLVWASFTAAEVSGADQYSRQDFPSAFVFGAGTSAYQVEGAANEDGRTPSIFDTYAHSGVLHGANGDIACDEYHRYKKDVQLMVEMNLEAYRFSISWSRLIPNGRGPVNPKGLQYYNNLINELVSHGFIYSSRNSTSCDTAPSRSPAGIRGRVWKDFTAYAEVCFREFGDRVHHWTTINEANVFVIGGYDSGSLPPQRCSFPFGSSVCSRGNSCTEPYLAAHNILLAHASAAKTYKTLYQNKQKGYIGFNIFAYHFSPLTNSTEDITATRRAYDFYIGWLADPLVYGDYPEIMKKNAGPRIPSLTLLESKLIKGSFDFLGINFYDAVKVTDNSHGPDMAPRDYFADTAVELKFDRNTSLMFDVNPRALQDVLEYFKETYGNPPIYIHENGQQMRRNMTLNDVPRVKYMQGYIGAVLDSLGNGSNTRGYFMWSFMDLLELVEGYNSGFGLYYVDLDDPDLKRYPKLSAHWYSHFLKGGRVRKGSNNYIEALGNSRHVPSDTLKFSFSSDK